MEPRDAPPRILILFLHNYFQLNSAVQLPSRQYSGLHDAHSSYNSSQDLSDPTLRDSTIPLAGQPTSAVPYMPVPQQQIYANLDAPPNNQWLEKSQSAKRRSKLIVSFTFNQCYACSLATWKGHWLVDCACRADCCRCWRWCLPWEKELEQQRQCQLQLEQYYPQWHEPQHSH